MSDTPKVVKLLSVAEMWASFSRDVLPKEASETHMRECRRSFYAGACAMLIDATFGIGDPLVPSAVGEAHLVELGLELKQFAQDVRAGKV